MNAASKLAAMAKVLETPIKSKAGKNFSLQSELRVKIIILFLPVILIIHKNNWLGFASHAPTFSGIFKLGTVLNHYSQCFHKHLQLKCGMSSYNLILFKNHTFLGFIVIYYLLMIPTPLR